MSQAETFDPLQVCGQGNRINQIKLFSYANYEILVSVDMSGIVNIFNTQNLKNPPIMLSNVYEEIEDCSTWSLDGHIGGAQKFIVVGSNS